MTNEFVMIMHRHRERLTGSPPVAGMPIEVWTWLHESPPVRPAAVAEARARLDAGDRPSAAELADAVLQAAV